ncbi:hypothetical protein F5883DRAFT_592734 [Diaporthe sp. PMI_573]|nr:hypothetical protein F5883DRAFT_592734 [Diaporthaceae sp. PMI_573]
MPFPFTYMCDLFQCLDNNRHKTSHFQGELVRKWFAQHQDLLGRPDFDPAALLRTFNAPLTSSLVRVCMGSPIGRSVRATDRFHEEDSGTISRGCR